MWTVSTLRDRVCMTAAMLVLEPNLLNRPPARTVRVPSWRNAQQAVGEGGGAAIPRATPEVVDADLARTTSEAFRMPNF